MKPATKVFLVLIVICSAVGVLSGYTTASPIKQMDATTPVSTPSSYLVQQANVTMYNWCGQVLESSSDSRYIRLPGVGGGPPRTPTPIPTPCPTEAMCLTGVGEENPPEEVGDENPLEAIPTIDLQSTERELNQAVYNACQQYQGSIEVSNTTLPSENSTRIPTITCVQEDCPEGGILLPPIRLDDTLNQFAVDVQNWVNEVTNFDSGQE